MDDGSIWMVDNLRYEVPDSWLYPEEAYPEDIPYDPERYGRLYTWEAAVAACAALGDGWHLPDDWEWVSLADAYGDWDLLEGINDDAYEALIAPGEDPRGSAGYSGFDARFGGVRNGEDVSFHGLGKFGIYWSAWDLADGDAMSYQFWSGQLWDGFEPQSAGLSCRCTR